MDFITKKRIELWCHNHNAVLIDLYEKSFSYINATGIWLMAYAEM